MGVATRLGGQRVRRAITIISVLAAIAVVLTTTGVVGRRTSSHPGADRVAAATGPGTTAAPEAPAGAPPAAVDPAVAAPEAIVRNVSTAEGDGDRLVDAPAEAVAAYLPASAPKHSDISAAKTRIRPVLRM